MSNPPTDGELVGIEVTAAYVAVDRDPKDLLYACTDVIPALIAEIRRLRKQHQRGLGSHVS